MFEHILEGMIKAGWVLIPLMLASVAGWCIVFHRFWALRGLEWRGLDRWRQGLRAEGADAGLEALTSRERGTVAGAAIHAVCSAREHGRATMEEALDEVMKFKIPELERSLSTLAILATAAPLMGLLGTVSGIVRTFQVISAFGTGNQALMSDSIAESLMATQNGLLVAFPLLLMHVLLTSRAEAIEHGALAAAHSLINHFAHADRPRPAPALGYAA